MRSLLMGSPLQALPEFLEFTIAFALLNVLFGQYTGGICSGWGTALYQQLWVAPQTSSSFLHRFHHQLLKSENK
jgi:hypothetical protein